jgi:hypothetical protein
MAAMRRGERGSSDGCVAPDDRSAAAATDPSGIRALQAVEGDNQFGLWLRKRRLERNLTQGQLADLADLSSAGWSRSRRVERNRHSRPDCG